MSPVLLRAECFFATIDFFSGAFRLRLDFVEFFFFELELFARVVFPDLLERAFEAELLRELSESRAMVPVAARQSAAEIARANRMILISSNNRILGPPRLPIAGIRKD